MDRELRVERLLDLLDGLEQLRQSFEREELALQRHQDRIRGRHRVDGEQVERRRTIDQHIGVGDLAGRDLVELAERGAQPVRAIARMADLELEARQIHGGRRDVQMRDRGGEYSLAQRPLAGDEIVGRDLPAFLVDAEPGRGVALRIEVDDEHALADGGERGAEIDRGRGLADAALLVGDRQHPRRRRGVRFRLARKRHDLPGIHVRRLLVIRHGVPSIPAESPGPPSFSFAQNGAGVRARSRCGWPDWSGSGRVPPGCSNI